MSFRSRGLISLACLLLAAALASCGASGSSSSSSASSTAPQPGAAATGASKAGSGMAATADGSKPAATSAAAGGSPASSPPAAANRLGAASAGAKPPPLTRASARRAEARAEAVQAARHRALARKAGNAAPFLVPVGDNSIPTYGSEAPAAELAAAGASLGAYLSAREAGEWSSACAQMAAAVQKQLALLAGGGEKPEGCAAAYAKLASHVPASARANPLAGSLTAFRVEADKAFALFYGPHEQQYMMPMVSEGGAWKVNQIEPITWPLGAPTASP